MSRRTINLACTCGHAAEPRQHGQRWRYACPTCARSTRTYARQGDARRVWPSVSGLKRQRPDGHPKTVTPVEREAARRLAAPSVADAAPLVGEVHVGFTDAELEAAKLSLVCNGIERPTERLAREVLTLWAREAMAHMARVALKAKGAQEAAP